MKRQFALIPLLVASLIFGWCSQSNAQEVGPFGGFEIPTDLSGAVDVTIGSTTFFESTDDKWQNFVRFSSPVDIDIKIEGIARWWADPHGVLWEIAEPRPIRIADDDNSGPDRDFLIEHRIEGGKTYVLQFGTDRTTTTSRVRITTKQIVVNGQLGAQSLQTAENAGDFLEQETFGRNIEASWFGSTDFGIVSAFNNNRRTFQIRDFAQVGSATITNISISSNLNQFFRSDRVPQSHRDSFRATMLSGNRFEVSFAPRDAGPIEATLVIDYVIDGVTMQAQMPMRGYGTGLFDWKQYSRSDFDSWYLHFEHSLSTDAGENRVAWISVDFEQPINTVQVFVIPKFGSSPVNVAVYPANDFQRGTQLHTNSINRSSSGSQFVGGASKANIKIQMPSTAEEVISDFDVYVFGY